MASVLFWVVELRLSMASHDERQEEVLVAYQQRQMELKSEAIRDMVQELYQTARTISLLPAIREAKGGNRRSVQDDVVTQGRFSYDSHRTLQQIYASLSAYVKVSEIYFVMDGFEPAKGEVPFFMYDDLISGGLPSKTSMRDHSDVPDVTEQEEYAEILRQLAWFRQNAPTDHCLPATTHSCSPSSLACRAKRLDSSIPCPLMTQSQRSSRARCPSSCGPMCLRPACLMCLFCRSHRQMCPK
jgi:hypothetical protein